MDPDHLSEETRAQNSKISVPFAEMQNVKLSEIKNIEHRSTLPVCSNLLRSLLYRADNRTGLFEDEFVEEEIKLDVIVRPQSK